MTVFCHNHSPVNVLHHASLFGYTIPRTPVRLAELSRNLKVVAEQWTESTRTLRLTLSGLASTHYRLRLTGAEQLASVQGARREGADAILVMPPGPTDTPPGSAPAYVSQVVTFELR